MKQSYIMIGVPGAGKSFQVNSIIQDIGLEVSVFSLDTCRLLFNDPDYKQRGESAEMYSAAFKTATDNPKAFEKFVTSEWAKAKQAGIVVVDNTNLTKKSRIRWVSELRDANFKITAINVMVPLQIAIDRQQTRGDKFVPESVIRDMYMRQQEVFVPDEADELINVYGY